MNFYHNTQNPLRHLIPVLGLVLLATCGPQSHHDQILVSNAKTLDQAIREAQPGAEIVMQNGTWKDLQIRFSAKGTEQAPILLRAETAGEVVLTGQSNLKIGGEYLVVEGLYFRNGFTPSNTVIQFKIDDSNIAYHCRVSQCAIEDFNQSNRYNPDHWVEFWGRDNQMDHCYLAGKSNQGPSVRVFLTGNKHIRNYHRIINNHFGPRPRKGGPRAETMQIGDSYTSMAPSYTSVSNNLFEKCNGEVEIISSKSNFNEFRNNVFFECEGSLVMRHGNYCVVDGNIFIGNKASRFMGGIRVINTGHWITNNYFYQLRANNFRAPLAIMNGIPKSPLNRYNQVTDAVVAFNTWVDCESPWQFSVGANMDKSDVLPATELRTARPIRTLLANNIIYNHQADEQPVKSYDEVDGIRFENNILDNQGEDPSQFGLTTQALQMDQPLEGLFIPAPSTAKDLGDVFDGFGFEDIRYDLFGNSRQSYNNIGATLVGSKSPGKLIDLDNYGPAWFSGTSEMITPETIPVEPLEGSLAKAIAACKSGDILDLVPGSYRLQASLVIDKKITIRSQNSSEPARLMITGAPNTAAFEMHPKGQLKLENLSLTGSGSEQAFAPLRTNMSSAYQLEISGCRIQGFKNILKAYKGSFADTISFRNTKFKDCEGGIELAAETDDRGDYNAEFLNVKNCEFKNVGRDVINYYRGGYDESTIGGNLNLETCRFENCGQAEKSKILIKTRGIINVDLVNNTFQNNKVELVALLWGEQPNHHSGNELINSGQIRVEQYLKQKLVY